MTDMPVAAYLTLHSPSGKVAERSRGKVAERTSTLPSRVHVVEYVRIAVRKCAKSAK
jgi:hypothetical protein